MGARVEQGLVDVDGDEDEDDHAGDVGSESQGHDRQVDEQAPPDCSIAKK